MKRPEKVEDAMVYLKSIWGDYGRHEDYTNALCDYVEELEETIQTVIELLQDGQPRK